MTMSNFCDDRNNTDCKSCLPHAKDRKWYYFVATSCAILLGGIVLIYSTRLLIRLCNKKPRKLNPRRLQQTHTNGHSEVVIEESDGLYVRLKEQAGALITAQTFKGRVLVVVSFLFSMCYVTLYIVEGTFPVEHCLQMSGQMLWKFEAVLNVFFIFHFALRFLAANDKLYFWIEPLSIVDFFTIPQVFVSLVIGQNWLGLRFLRAMQLIKLADILQFIGVISTSGSITLAAMIGKLLALWLTFGGLVHLTENSGDPWNFDVVYPIDYFTVLYYLVVTMSTVGFGDVLCQTVMGKIIIMIFICIGLGVFATYIPAIMDYMSSHTEYHGAYKPTEGRKHIVLCGHITRQSVENFLRDFLHEDRADANVNVVVMANFLPGNDLQVILKRHFVQVSFFIGTVLSGEDCNRVKMARADAVLVLCNKSCGDPGLEDTENIMRVVAIKNHCPRIRVIVQLLQYHNKAHLLNIPSWSSKDGDDVVCISELKLGFLAQSCLSPGFSTMLSNIFSMRSNEQGENVDENEWKSVYIRGTNTEMYTERLSPSFKGMTFQQASEICFEKLSLMLIAIEIIKPDGEKNFAINPAHDRNLVVESNTRGYFLAGSSNEVKRALYYCSQCHYDVKNPNYIKECHCAKLALARERDHSGSNGSTSMLFPDQQKKTPLQKIEPLPPLPSVVPSISAHAPGRKKEQVKLERILAVSENNRDGELQQNFILKNPKHDQSLPLSSIEKKDHRPQKRSGSYKVLSRLKAIKDQQSGDQVQPAVPGKPKFDVTGTFYWCEPRSYEDVILTRDEAYQTVWHHHIVVCVFNDRDAPLLGVRTLVMPLRASNLHQSELKKIVFLGNKEYMEREWEQLCNFDETYVMPGSPFCRADLRAINANLAEMVVFVSPTNASLTDEKKLADKESILASLNLKAMSFDDSIGLLRGSTQEKFQSLEMFGSNNKLERRGSAYGCNIPMITELVHDYNVQYLDIDDDDEEDCELYLTQPFACGTAFTVSVLDSLMSATYYNPPVLTLVRHLVTGGVNPILEEQLAEGEGIRGGYETAETAETRSRCKITQMSLFEGPLAQYGAGGIFGEMFLYAVKNFSMICLGIYRFRDSGATTLVVPSSKRYVITAPPYEFRLKQTDLVFALAQSDVESNKDKATQM